jgi:hypothetical protein
MSDKWVTYSHRPTQTKQQVGYCIVATFDAQTSHGHARTHKIHHNLDLGEATTFPLIVFFMISHEGYIQMSFFPKTPKLGISKISKLGPLWFWRPITSFSNLQLR